YRCERLECWRQFEAMTNRRRLPLTLNDAVCKVNEAHPGRGLSRLCGERRNHGIQERQRHSNARTSEERPPGKRFLRDEHGGLLTFASAASETECSLQRPEPGPKTYSC